MCVRLLAQLTIIPPPPVTDKDDGDADDGENDAT